MSTDMKENGEHCTYVKMTVCQATTSSFLLNEMQCIFFVLITKKNLLMDILPMASDLSLEQPGSLQSGQAAETS